MCLALPVRVVSVADDGGHAVVEVGGITKVVSLALVDGVQPGDYVILHVGYALARLDVDEAERTLELMAQIGAAPP